MKTATSRPIETRHVGRVVIACTPAWVNSTAGGECKKRDSAAAQEDLSRNEHIARTRALDFHEPFAG
jgi:hypothetical protein